MNVSKPTKRTNAKKENKMKEHKIKQLTHKEKKELFNSLEYITI